MRLDLMNSAEFRALYMTKLRVERVDNGFKRKDIEVNGSGMIVGL